KYRFQFTGRRTDDLKHLRGCDLLLLQFAHLTRAQVELLPEGRVASDVASSWLPTTFCRRRPVEPRPGAFALHAATSFHCCPRAKKKRTEYSAYCSMV